METSSVIQIIGASTTFFSLLSAWFWNLHNKSKKEWADLREHFDRRITDATTACVNKQRDIHVELSSHRDFTMAEFQKVRQEASEHRQITISELETRRLIDDQVGPVRDELRALKQDTHSIINTITSVQKSLGRIEGAMEALGAISAERRRRDEQ